MLLKCEKILRAAFLFNTNLEREGLRLHLFPDNIAVDVGNGNLVSSLQLVGFEDFSRPQHDIRPGKAPVVKLVVDVEVEFGFHVITFFLSFCSRTL